LTADIVIEDNRFAPSVTRDRTLGSRAVLRKHGRFTNSRGIFDREDCGMKFLLAATGLIVGSNTPPHRPGRGQDAKVLPGDAKIRVALARN
jgi:hypothetical protein